MIWTQARPHTRSASWIPTVPARSPLAGPPLSSGDSFLYDKVVAINPDDTAYAICFVNKTCPKPGRFIWICCDEEAYNRSLQHLKDSRYIKILEAGRAKVRDTVDCDCA